MKKFLLGAAIFADGEMNGVKYRTIVVLAGFAVSGLFVANVLATARPDGTAVTVPTVPTTVPTVATTVPTVATTVPTVATTVPTVATTVPTVATTVSTVVPTVPTTTVRASTPVTTASVTTPSSIPVETTAATKGSTTVAVQPGTHAPAPRGPVKTNRKPGTTSTASEGSAAGSPVATVANGLSRVAGSTVSAAWLSMPVVASRAGKPVVSLSRLRLERLPGRRSAVGLRLVLSRPARVRFLVVGPAPSCQVAGRFVLAGHQGLNKVAFRGRIRGKLLGPGIYTIVPQPAAGSPRLAKTVAVAIDAHGIRPTAPVRWRNCDPADAATGPTVSTGHGVPTGGLRFSGVAGEARAATKRQRATEPHPVPVFAWLPSIPKPSQLSALLLTLLAVAMLLLSIASAEPGHTLRFRTVRVIARHQAQVGWLGGALLVSAILLFLLGS